MLSRLMASWKESLVLFLPGNIKLFFLVSLKTMLSTYSVLLRYGVPLFFVVWVGIHYSWLLPPPFSWLINALTLLVLWALMITVAARPCVIKKTVSYFNRYWLHTLFIMVMVIVLWKSIESLFLFAYYIARHTSVYISYSTILVMYPLMAFLFFSFEPYLLCISPLIVFSILFITDSSVSIKRFFVSIKRAFIMVVYNYPGCAIFYFIFRELLLGLTTGLNIIGLPLTIIDAIMLLLLPIPLVVFTCFYTKRLHDQFQRYFSSPTL